MPSTSLIACNQKNNCCADERVSPGASNNRPNQPPHQNSPTTLSSELVKRNDFFPLHHEGIGQSVELDVDIFLGKRV